ncbi:MAG: 3-deoxy-D-manno-octulosonic acid transferase [Maribacter sp.]|nr:3-deoxy-D-manno-octulosonic acid transferase [Maribacter sp.]
MNFIYNLIIHITWFHLKIVALFHPKIKLFVQGRRQTYSILKNKIRKENKLIWVHTASLGEFEQGLPIIERLKSTYPNYQLLVTFFSPSGFEVKKNSDVADAVVYLPLDTRKNAKRFLEMVNPSLAIFVKYEIWPNYLKELKEKQVPVLLISAMFRKEQVFFKWYGGIMRKALGTFTHFFVQDNTSVALLEGIKLTNTTISGDTRFDRVAEILERNNKLSFMESFKGNKICFVAGSTWPEDEELIVKFINETQKQLKFVLAPHNIKAEHIQSLKKSIAKKVLLYSEIGKNDTSSCQVIIINTVGLLTKIYSYADIAYVGGAFATGLHNTLEPAVFGIPILIGPKYKGFNEAAKLVAKKGILVTTNYDEFTASLDALLDNPDHIKNTGTINSNFVKENIGASVQIMAHIRRLL